jgi:stearoyl-CoA desaturase (delta-9 desaturase)
MATEIIYSPMLDRPRQAAPSEQFLPVNSIITAPANPITIALRVPAKAAIGDPTMNTESKPRSYGRLVAFGYAIGPVLIIASHACSLLLINTGINLAGLAWLIGWYLLRMLAITAIYHRLLVHRSYRAPRFLLRFGCLLAAAAGQMGPSWWKAHHLKHHRQSDQIGDPHSPHIKGGGWRGFVVSQAGWLLSTAFFPSHLPADVESDPVLKAIDRLHFLPFLFVCCLSYFLGGTMLMAAFCLSTTLLFHGVATVNSLAHLWGEQPFQTSDYSRNNSFVSHITLGEGWHNTHHAFSYSCRHGLAVVKGKIRHLIDPTYGFILLLSRFGLATGLKLPSNQQLLVAFNPNPGLQTNPGQQKVHQRVCK